MANWLKLSDRWVNLDVLACVSESVSEGFGGEPGEPCLILEGDRIDMVDMRVTDKADMALVKAMLGDYRPIKPIETLLGEHDITRHLSCNSRQLKKLIAAGRFPQGVSLDGGSMVRWTRGQLQEFMDGLPRAVAPPGKAV